MSTVKGWQDTARRLLALVALALIISATTASCSSGDSPDNPCPQPTICGNAPYGSFDCSDESVGTFGACVVATGKFSTGRVNGQEVACPEQCVCPPDRPLARNTDDSGTNLSADGFTNECFAPTDGACGESYEPCAPGSHCDTSKAALGECTGCKQSEGCGACIDTTRDRLNCGACGVWCGGISGGTTIVGGPDRSILGVCANSACVCASPFVDCGCSPHEADGRCGHACCVTACAFAADGSATCSDP